MALPRCLALVVIASFSSQLCKAQVGFLGPCPVLTPVQNFDPARYLGTWYEYGKYFNLPQYGGKCVEATYTDNGNGVIGVKNFQKGQLNEEVTIVGKATPVSPGGTEAKYLVTFPSIPFNSLVSGIRREGNYWVLDTDYDSFAIVWSCKNLFVYNFQNLFVLTRERQPPTALVAKVTKEIQGYGLSTNTFHETDQNGC